MKIKYVIVSALFLLTTSVFAQTASEKNQMTMEQIQTVNINSAGVQELTKVLDGIGKEKATAIVDYRKTHGKFTEMKQLIKVEGIGRKLIEKNKKKIIF